MDRKKQTEAMAKVSVVNFRRIIGDYSVREKVEHIMDAIDEIFLLEELLDD